MAAGATGIDLFLLVIDAGEGARTQTHEHLAILRLLGIENGVVAVTKADAVDPETLELALDEGRELVPGAEVVAVSAKTGLGIDELRDALGRAARSRTHADGPTRLYVDRVFTLRGIGTVATGTLWSGSVAEGQSLQAEPAGLEVRVRSVQVHDQPVERAEAGQRVAVALPGIERMQLRRGDALVTAGAFRPSYRLDVTLETLAEVPARAQVHHGTSQVVARIARVGEGYAQLRLSAPLVAARGDRFVVRTATTVAGGRVLDAAPPRHADPVRMELVERGEIAATIHAPVRRESVAHLLDSEPAELELADGWLFSPAWLAELRAELECRLDEADPLDPGIDAPAAPWASAIVPLLGLEQRGSRLYAPGSKGDLGVEAERVAAEVDAAGLSPVKVDPKLGRALERNGKLVRLGGGLAVSPRAYDRARRAVVEECETAGKITLARLRDLLGISRRPAQLLLERMDTDGITRRLGDERVLRRAARETRSQT